MTRASRQPGSVHGNVGRGRPSLPAFSQLRAATLTHDLQAQLRPGFNYRTGRALAGFETAVDAVDEDQLRARLLRQSGLSGAAHLSSLLAESDTHFAHDTLASKAYCRQMRRVMADQLQQLVSATPAPSQAWTLVLPSWQVPGADLSNTATAGIHRRLRAALAAAGRPAGEWAWGQVHGDFDISTQTFQLHVHGLATPHYISCLDAFRQDRFRRIICVPLKVQPLRDLPRQVSYALQSFWPHRPIVTTNCVPKRTDERWRIPEPWGSQVLLWLNRQTLGTMQIKVGLTNSTCSLQVRNSG